MPLSSRPHLYYAGLLTLACLTIGGATATDAWTDKALQIAMLPALFLGLGGLLQTRLATTDRLLVVFILFVCAIQFFPLSRAVPGVDVLPFELNSQFLTRDAGQTVNGVLFALSALGLALYISRFNDQLQERLLSFVLLGAFLNVTIALVQLSYSKGVAEQGILPYVLRAGFFTNENHFATLVFSTLPLFAFFALIKVRSLLLFTALSGVALLSMFALGSRAGMGISVVLSGFCVLWFWLFRESSRARLGMFFALFAAFILALGLPLYPNVMGNDLRVELFTSAFTVISDYFPFGSGFGTFENLYGTYFPERPLTEKVVNHFHNDYLEVVMESGIFGLLAIAALVALIIRNMFRSFLTNAAAICLFSILIHSTIDYPLRTMAIAAIFAFATGIVFSKRTAGPANRRKVKRDARPATGGSMKVVN